MSPRSDLRAYEGADCCRAARILVDLAAEGVAPASRDALAERWAARYPRDRELTGKRAIRDRLSTALGFLAFAGLVDRHEDRSVSILDHDRLAMASRNLDIVESADGETLRTRQWSRRPEVPERLRGQQDQFFAHLTPARTSGRTSS